MQNRLCIVVIQAYAVEADRQNHVELEEIRQAILQQAASMERLEAKIQDQAKTISEQNHIIHQLRKCVFVIRPLGVDFS